MIIYSEQEQILYCLGSDFPNEEIKNQEHIILSQSNLIIPKSAVY